MHKKLIAWIANQDVENKIYCRQILDLLIATERTKLGGASVFLPPGIKDNIISIASHFYDLQKEFFPKNCERQIFCTSFYQNFDEINDISIVQIEAFEKISHREILGSLIGEGIERDRIGDIRIKDNKAEIAVKDNIADYLFFNFKKVGKQNINIVILNKKEFSIGEAVGKTKKVVIASNRIDIYVAALISAGRKQSRNLIASERVKINHQYIKNPAHRVVIGDLLSIRGYGRFIVEKKIGETKKENQIIKIRYFS